MEREQIKVALKHKFGQRFEVLEVGTFYQISWSGGASVDEVLSFLREKFPEADIEPHRKD